MTSEPWRERYLVFGAPAFGPEERAAMLACLDSGWVGSGPRVAELEERFRTYVGAPAAVAVAVSSFPSSPTAIPTPAASTRRRSSARSRRVRAP